MALVAMSGIGKHIGEDNTPYIDEYGNLVDYTGGATASSTPSSTDWFSSILSSAPSIISAFTGKGSVATKQSMPYTTGTNVSAGQPQSTGISTNTIFLLGAAGLAAYFLLKKK